MKVLNCYINIFSDKIVCMTEPKNYKHCGKYAGSALMLEAIYSLRSQPRNQLESA